MKLQRYLDTHPSSMTALWLALDKEKTFEVTRTTTLRLAGHVLDAIILHAVAGHTDLLPPGFHRLGAVPA